MSVKFNVVKTIRFLDMKILENDFYKVKIFRLQNNIDVSIETKNVDYPQIFCKIEKTNQNSIYFDFFLKIQDIFLHDEEDISTLHKILKNAFASTEELKTFLNDYCSEGGK